MSEIATPAFSSPESESHPGSAGTPDVSTPEAELEQALETARAAEAHVLELMVAATPTPMHTPPPADIGPYPMPAAAEPIRVHRLHDRQRVIIVQGDQRVHVSLELLERRLGKRPTGLELQQLAPDILAHPSDYGVTANA